MTSEPLVSVITPFYNTASYLEECIASVLRQTYRNLEYVLCDNCSNDGSSAIARRLAASDPRVRYLRFDELLPQVENYNRALEHLNPAARWCKIVQADDWLFEHCLARMVRVGEQDEAIGLVSSCYLMGEVACGKGLQTDREIFDGKAICRYQLRDRVFFMGSPTTVMYRADIVRNRRPFYALNRYHEDTEAAYEILERWKMGFVHEVLSFLRTGNPSIMQARSAYDTYLIDRFITVERYADRFLPPAEAAALKARTRRRYFTFLGESLLRRRKADFWEYHRGGLLTVGWSWPTWRVLGGAALFVLKLIFNPSALAQRTLRYAAKHLSFRRSKPEGH
jgi:glycosyltransferase involved in cell wall biosynthesis